MDTRRMAQPSGTLRLVATHPVTLQVYALGTCTTRVMTQLAVLEEREDGGWSIGVGPGPDGQGLEEF